MRSSMQLSKYAVTLTAIIAIAVLEAIALVKGIDGQLLSVTIATIAGLGGYMAAQATSSNRNKE